MLSLCAIVTFEPLFSRLTLTYRFRTLPSSRVQQIVSGLHRVQRSTEEYVYFLPVHRTFSVVNANQCYRFQIGLAIRAKSREHHYLFKSLIRGLLKTYGLSLLWCGIGTHYFFMLLMILDLSMTQTSIPVIT